MSKSISEKDILEAIKDIMHPAINHSLLDLGIVKNIKVEDDKAVIIIAFPFPNIPIAKQLINSVKLPVEKLGVEVKMETTVMNQEEVNKFLAMEQSGWKGM